MFGVRYFPNVEGTTRLAQDKMFSGRAQHVFAYIQGVW